MMRVARPTTIPSRTIDRLILITALALLIGIPVMVFVYWSDRHVDPGGSLADRTVAAAEAAVQADPNDIQARDHLAAAYVSAKRYDEGIVQFTEALKLDATDRAALLGRAIAYTEVEQPDAAEADLNVLISAASQGEFASSDPELQHAYYQLGIVQLAQERPADAVATLEKALAIDGGDADSLYALGTALVQTGEPDQAVQVLRLAVAFVPTGWCDPYQRLGEAYTALNQAAGVTWASGMVSFCDGRLDEAATTLKSLTAGTMKADALLGLALVTSAQGDNAAAIDYYRQVLALDPTNQSAAIGLSSLGGEASTMPSEAASPTAGDN